MKQKTEPRELEKDAIKRLHDLLVRVPFLYVSKPIPGSLSGAEMFPTDGFLQVRHGHKSWWFILEVKSNAQLRDARLSIDYLLRLSKHFGAPAYPVFASQYLSKSIRELCVENDVGYFDFSGNCRLVFDPVFIERDVPASETQERKRLKSLFSLKSARVLRRLLHEPRVHWKVQMLAESAHVSPATVSLVKDKLLREEYAVREGESFFVSQPEKLLMDWSRHYDWNQHEQIECYGPADFEELERQFARHCTKNSIDYAFTMFSGAKRVASFTRGIQRGYAYVQTSCNLHELAAALNLKPVESGGNFRLITPKDDDLLFGRQKVDGDYVVSDVQLYLDLAGHRGRGEENAEFLLEHRIRPKW